MSRGKFVSLGTYTQTAFLERASERLTLAQLPGADPRSCDHRGAFRGTGSLGEALDLVRHGWPDGIRQIADAMKDAELQPITQPVMTLGLSGFMPCMPVFFAGEPECMLSLEPTPVTNRGVMLVAPVAYGHTVEAWEVTRYAGNAAAVIAQLQAAAIPVGMCAVDVCYENYTVGYGVKVLELGEPLDLARLAAVFHPSFLRRVCLAWRERTEECVTAGLASGVYGRPAQPTSAADERLQAILAGALAPETKLAVLPPIYPGRVASAAQMMECVQGAFTS